MIITCIRKLNEYFRKFWIIFPRILYNIPPSGIQWNYLKEPYVPEFLIETVNVNGSKMSIASAFRRFSSWNLRSCGNRTTSASTRFNYGLAISLHCWYSSCTRNAAQLRFQFTPIIIIWTLIQIRIKENASKQNPLGQRSEASVRL